jgi:chromate reductase, NAD(P)H dehydrogenase (quinone)
VTVPRRVLLLVGSLRAGSANRELAAMVAASAPSHWSTEVLLPDLPLYDGDLEAEGPPPEVVARKALVAAADGLLVVSPEYNYGIPGPLKNTLDWLSRPGYRSVLRDRAVGVLGAAPGPVGTARGQGQLKQVLLGVAAAVFPWPELTVSTGGRPLADADAAAAGVLRSRLEDFVAGFDRWMAATAGYREARGG